MTSYYFVKGKKGEGQKKKSNMFLVKKEKNIQTKKSHLPIVSGRLMVGDTKLNGKTWCVISYYFPDQGNYHQG